MSKITITRDGTPDTTGVTSEMISSATVAERESCGCGYEKSQTNDKYGLTLTIRYGTGCMFLEHNVKEKAR